MNGQVDPSHIYPMSKAKEKALNVSTNFTSLIHHPDLVTRRVRQIRAKMIETEWNIHQQSERKGPDRFHVLVESATGKKIKAKAMSRADAAERNESIASIGYEWTLGEM